MGHLDPALEWSSAAGFCLGSCAVPRGAGAAWHGKNTPPAQYSPVRAPQLGCREKEPSGAASPSAAVGPGALWLQCHRCQPHRWGFTGSFPAPYGPVCVWQEADEPTVLGWLNLQPHTASLGQFRTAGVSKKKPQTFQVTC